MDIVSTKILVAILFGLVRFLAGILPVKLRNLLQSWERPETGAKFVSRKRDKQLQSYVALIEAFGGGVLFATCLLHMMPEVYYSVEEMRKFGELPGHYPYSQLIVSAGFFLVYFIEEFSHWLVSVTPQKPACEKQKQPSARSIMPTETKINPIQAFTDLEDKKSENGKPFVVEISETKSEDSSLEMEEDKELANLLENNTKTKQQVLRCFLIAAALSLHAFFEGLAIGLQHSRASIWYLFTAVSIHSATVLFCIGLDLLIAKTKTKTIILHMLMLAATSPIGVFLGLVISLSTNPEGKAKSITVIVLEGLSAGTILYITFFEVLNKEKERRVCVFRRAFSILGGFTLMALLEFAKIYD